MLNIEVDADVKHYADSAARAANVTTALWVQELIRREEQVARSGADAS